MRKVFKISAMALLASVGTVGVSSSASAALFLNRSGGVIDFGNDHLNDTQSGRVRDAQFLRFDDYFTFTLTHTRDLIIDVTTQSSGERLAFDNANFAPGQVGNGRSRIGPAANFPSNRFRPGDVALPNVTGVDLSEELLLDTPTRFGPGTYTIQIGGTGQANATYEGFLQFLPIVGEGVPEPTTWAMMIGGFGMIGGTLRRRAVKTSVRFA